VNPNVTTFTDRSGRRGVRWYYRVRATNNYGVSAWSPWVSTLVF
jgi:hypothetical protein